MKKIAVITGATGGLGREFCELLSGRVDEIWAIARNRKRLKELEGEFPVPVVTLSVDLAGEEGLSAIKKLLEEKRPRIQYLVNSAGIGKLGSYRAYSPEETSEIINVNSRSVAVMCSLCIPYMRRGGRIINLSSQSAFQPLPYLNLYAATKAFVRSYTRALNAELKSTGITATAVCPGWIDTPLLPRVSNHRVICYPGIVKPAEVAVKALVDADRGKDMSVYTGFVKSMHVTAKLAPQKLVMKVWEKGVRRYL